MKKIKEVLSFLDQGSLYPDLRLIESAVEPEVVIDGKKVLMYSSNNYLGLATHPKLIEAAIEATKKYGVGSDGSRLLSGNLKVHRDFELAIAKFKGGEDAIAYPCGYSANVGTISAIVNPAKFGPQSFLNLPTLIFSDSLNHASIIDGCKMSKREVIVYKHCDMDDLEQKLDKHKRRRKLVITDGVFSMDGDIAPLDKISKLCKNYNAMLMIDEAHATGMLGASGHGTTEHFNLKPIEDVDIILGTCSKALASAGGFVVGSSDLVRYLKIASRSYIFSTAPTPASSASLITALSVMENEPQHRQRMWENAVYLRDNLNKLGFHTFGSQTQIIPILIGSDESAIVFSRRLFAKNIYGPCVRWPAVEKDKARIRFTVMASHSKDQLDNLLNACSEIGKDLKII